MGPRRWDQVAARPPWTRPRSRPPARRDLTRKAADEHRAVQHGGDPPALRGPLRGQRPHRGAVGLAAARRPEPALRQRRHGAVQALLPRPGDPAVRRARSACRSACAPSTSRRSARPPGTARSSRCAATSPSATTSRRARSSSPGTWSPSRRPTAARLRRVAALRLGLRRRRRGGRALDARVTGLPDDRIIRLGKKDNYWSHGRARPGRPVLGDPHRPRARRSAPTATSRTRGPLPGVLEPRLHAGRAHRRSARKEDFDIVGSAAEEEHRHRHGPGAGRLPAPGRRQHVRDRRDVPRHRARRGAHRATLRRRPRRRRPVPGRRRPRAQRADADRRRRDPGQRGPRLRAAPPAAPRGALDAAARRRGPGRCPSCCRSAATRWARPTPSSQRDWERISTVAYAEEDAFRQTLRAGTQIFDLAAAEREEARAARQLSGDQAFAAARHLRLPDRPDPGDGGRAGADRRRARASGG